MNDSPTKSPIGNLHQALGLKDLVLLNIVCIVSLSALSQVAQLGFSSVTLIFICIFTFLIPISITVAELNTRMPEEGGFYLWTRKAFGDLHGYIAAWSYWLSTVVWLATVLMLISIPALYLLGDRYLFLTESSWYNGLFGTLFIWFVTLLNIFGMERAKWIQNIGGMATWLCILLLAVGGITYVASSGPANAMNASEFIPEIWNLKLLPFIALVPFSFGGLELAPIMAGEIRQPRKNIPKAILYSAIAVGLIYIIGTGMLLFIIPRENIGVIEGVSQAFYHVGHELDAAGLAFIGILLAVLSPMGLFGGWMTGNARVPFVIGLDHYLPRPFTKVHPKYGSPYVSLIMQSITITLLFVISNAGSTVEEAFLVLLEMSIILYFIPFLYMFAAFAWHVGRDTGGPGLFGFLTNNKMYVVLVTFFGFTTTLVATLFSCFPPEDVSNDGIYILKVVGGAIFLIAVGLIVYFRKNDARIKPDEG